MFPFDDVIMHMSGCFVITGQDKCEGLHVNIASALSTTFFDVISYQIKANGVGWLINNMMM